MKRCTGFTLIEVLVVVGILAILAAVVVPQIVMTGEDARPAVMATTVRHIRHLIEYQGAIGEGPTAASGYPVAIDPDWFLQGMPKHMWTSRALIVDIEEDDHEDEVYPAQKTFDPSVVGATNAWYNPGNGAFCAFVPLRPDPKDIMDTFNFVNSADITTLDQTTMN